MTTPELQRFAEVVARDPIDLATASLLVGEDVDPGLDVPGCLAQLDAMGATLRARLPGDAFPEQRLVALNHFLFGELGFSGNGQDYYDPRNSYLHEVLARRTGIPITLSIVYMEVGRRVGLNLQGVSFPGHFLVKLKVKRGQLILDPFLGGEPLSEEELKRRLARLLRSAPSDAIDVSPYLEQATARQILVRVLRNLKTLYLEREELERALLVMGRMLLVVPHAAEEIRDRGLLYQRLECFRPALADLQDYLRRSPAAPDRDEIEERIDELKRAGRRLN